MSDILKISNCLKINWDILKTFKSLFEQTWLELGSTESEVVRTTPPQEPGEKTYLEEVQKQRKEIIWLAIALSLGGCFLIDCP